MHILIGRLFIAWGVTLLWFTTAWAVTDNQEAICDQPYVIFCDNFEARPLGDFSSGLPPTYKNGGWSTSSLQGGIIPAPTIVGPTGVESGQVFAGSQAVQIHAPAGANNGGPYIQGYFIVSAPDVYFRWYEHWSADYGNWPPGGQKNLGAGYAAGSGQNIMPRKPGQAGSNPNGGSPDNALLGYYTLGIVPPGACGDSFYQVGTQNSSQLCQQQNFTTFVPGPWYCLEWHTRNSSCPTCSDGIIEGWINGLPVGSYPNLNTDVFEPAGSTRYFNAIYFTGSINCWGGSVTDGYNCYCPGGPGTCDLTVATHTDLYKWMDNLVIATQRVGCLGTPPPPPPPSAPLPPMNLRVSSLWDQLLNIFSTLARLLG